MAENRPKNKSINVKITLPAEKAAGDYCNLAAIRHTRAEFVFDFVFRVENEGHVVSRIITNPAHAKALLVALDENIHKYEENFGQLTPEPQPNILH